jgi:sugar phosphate isomerase/epimerase
MNHKINFGVQSWCFRHFKDNTTVARLILETGVNQTELCSAYADFHQPAEFKNTVRTYRDAGVHICSLGVLTLKGEPNERDFFECAAIAGARHISAHFQVDTFPAAIKQAQKLSDEFNIKIGLHCHGGYMFGGQPDVMDHLIKLGAPQIGLCIDTAWCMQIGPQPGNPLEWLKRYAGHIHGIHFKDFTFDRSGQWKDVIIGEGNLDLPAFTTALKNNGFNGMSVIEYEGDVENPIPALQNCVTILRQQLG